MFGVFLATYNMTIELTGEDPDILTFQLNEVTLPGEFSGLNNASVNLRSKTPAAVNNV